MINKDLHHISFMEIWNFQLTRFSLLGFYQKYSISIRNKSSQILVCDGWLNKFLCAFVYILLTSSSFASDNLFELLKFSIVEEQKTLSNHVYVSHGAIKNLWLQIRLFFLKFSERVDEWTAQGVTQLLFVRLFELI